MPKTGSTFIASFLVKYTGYPMNNYSYNYGNSVMDLYYPSLVKYYKNNHVLHPHIHATTSNIQLINKFSMTPIILIRRIEDILISLREYVNKHHYLMECFFCFGPKTEYWSPGVKNQTCDFIVNDFLHRPENEQMDILIDLCSVWLISFYVSWSYAINKGRVEAKIFKYEDFVSDPVSFFEKMTDFAQIPQDKDKIVRVLDEMSDGIKSSKNHNFNVGKIGRGKEILTKEQSDRIRRLSNYFDDITIENIL